jgi:hypothetical protein
MRRHPMTVIRAIKRGELEAISGLGRPYLLTRSVVLAWALGEDDGDKDGAAVATPPPDPNPPAAADPDRRISHEALVRRRAMTPKRKAA